MPLLTQLGRGHGIPLRELLPLSSHKTYGRVPNEHNRDIIDQRTQQQTRHSKDDEPSRSMRKAIVLATGTAGLVLLVNTTLLLVGADRFDPKHGVGTIYTGNCDAVKYWNTALHLLINLLGIALLGASSFTMQCLSSPTRLEVDKAHAKRIALDIGVASVRNLWHLDWKRGVLWWTLLASTLPLHLL